MTVLYEDNHIIAVNKTCNEIVQGDKTGDTPLSETVKAYIKAKYDKPGEVFLGVTHRLDRPTSGVVLFARTSKALARLNAMFQSHDQIKKTYWAIVQGAPKMAEARLENWLVRNEKQNKSYIVESRKSRVESEKSKAEGAKWAALTYKTLVRGDHYTLLEVNLETGRHHQIRCQLAAIGCPIKGDLKYGAKRSNPDGGISLHARQIEFIHPVSKQNICITAPVPEEALWQALTRQIS
ncbi:MAG: RluA family pseudouridine synthase [Paludibacteraceae bacterium]|nr:RluA family pseudouridine synthase [Paludibacteraceae bacterium]MBQ6765285.1 RluA family pseudouridine synthase [Paludibacteraceae bacterium]